jgi:hypothetical protein
MLKICDRVQRDGFSDQKNVTRRGIYAPDARAVVNVVKIRNQGKRLRGPTKKTSHETPSVLGRHPGKPLAEKDFRWWAHQGSNLEPAD